MAGKADVENPISLVSPAHAKSVQAILDRAHKQETSADKALSRSIEKSLRPPRGKGLLSKTLGLALSNRGSGRMGGGSIRPTAPDTNGRAFHFSHSTVGKNDGSGRAKAGASKEASGSDKGGSGKTAEKAQTADKAAPEVDLGSKEAGHQRYVERDTALARDATEEFSIPLPGASAERDGTDRAAGRDTGSRDAAARKTDTRKIETDVAALQKGIEKASATRRLQSAEAAQAYIEDPAKVVPQTRHGHSNSFGTIGATFEERVKYWNDVQQHEREKDARTQIRLVLELPHEASAAARQEIVKRFCEEYERLGVPYWASIHAPTKKNDDRNHHAHIVHGIRPARIMIDPGTGEPAWDFTITETYRKKNRVKKTRHPFRQNVTAEFRQRDYVKNTRKRFAETANEVLQRHGCPVRYDPRSYKDMGLGVEPMKHTSRIITDKTKIYDFVVMDPEWTRKMVEREMHLAALHRDRTYVQLEEVERRLAEASRDVKKVRDANAKLPMHMRVSPLSTLTVPTAKRITTKMLKIERARIEQWFVDEATERTIQNVLDSTLPTSPVTGGKARRAKPVEGSEAPDPRAMAFLHQAAKEEMRLHRIATASRMRSLSYRAMGATAEWRREANPAPALPTEPAQETIRGFMATATAYHAPETDAGNGAGTARAQPSATAASQDRPDRAPNVKSGEALPEQPARARAGPTFAPGASPTEMVLATASSARMKTAISGMAEHMGSVVGNLIAMSDGPQELADIVKARLAPKTRAPEPATKIAEAATPTTERPKPLHERAAHPVATDTVVAPSSPEATTRRSTEPGVQTVVGGKNAETEMTGSTSASVGPPRTEVRAEPRDDGSLTRSLFARLDLGRKPDPARPAKEDGAPRAAPAELKPAPEARPLPSPTNARTKPDQEPPRATEGVTCDGSATPPAYTEPTLRGEDRLQAARAGQTKCKEPIETEKPVTPPPPAATPAPKPAPKPRMLGPDDFLPKRPRFKKLVRNPEIAPGTILDLPVLRPEKPGTDTAPLSTPQATAAETPAAREATSADAAKQEQEARRKLRRKFIFIRNNGRSR